MLILHLATNIYNTNNTLHHDFFLYNQFFLIQNVNDKFLSGHFFPWNKNRLKRDSNWRKTRLKLDKTKLKLDLNWTKTGQTGLKVD